MATDFTDSEALAAGSGPAPVLRVLRERWKLIVAVTIVGLVIGVAYGVAKSKSYTATSRLYIQEQSLVSNTLLNSSGSTEDPTMIAATNQLLLTSSTVGQRAKQLLGTTEAVADLTDQVTASQEPNSDLYDIAVTDPDPARAARIANAFAAAFVTYNDQLANGSVQSAQKQLQARLATLPKTDTTDRAAITAALQRLAAVGYISNGTASIVGTATAPTTPSSPKSKLDAALGLILGLAFGIAFAFVRDLADRRIKDAEGFEAAYGLRTLARISPRSLAAAGSDPRVPAFEPYRVLAGTLRFSRATSGVRSLLISSAVSGEGKTTVAAGLAKALAASGLAVILVELDHRRPSLNRHFDLEPGGLTNVIMGRGTLVSELQKPEPDLPALRVLPTGPHMAVSPLELLRSAEMDQVMGQLLELSDLVIYDTPPVVGIADTQALMDHPRLDASLIVAGARRVTKEEVKRARAILEARAVRPLGLVITGLEEPGAASDYYYYAPAVPVDDEARSDGGNGRGPRRGRRQGRKQTVNEP